MIKIVLLPFHHHRYDSATQAQIRCLHSTHPVDVSAINYDALLTH